MQKGKRIAWWRCLLGCLVFVACLFLLPGIITFARWIMDKIPFSYLRETDDERWAAGYTLAPFASFFFAYKIMGRNNLFLTILSALAGIYCIVVAVHNYVLHSADGYLTILVGIGGVIYIGIAIASGIFLGKESMEKKENGQNT